MDERRAEATLRATIALINDAEVRLASIRRDQRRSIEENPESDSIGVVVRTAEGYLEKAKRWAMIVLCPTPSYHETHRYCPSCPWTEADDGPEGRNDG